LAIDAAPTALTSLFVHRRAVEAASSARARVRGRLRGAVRARLSGGHGRVLGRDDGGAGRRQRGADAGPEGGETEAVSGTGRWVSEGLLS
jgi:hypothetical protein